VAGGVRLNEPAIDLGIVSSVVSSFLGRPIDVGTVVCGEVGLTGEVRGVGHMEARIKESAKMGFNRCIIPKTISGDVLPEAKMTLIKVSDLNELIDRLF
jgi:DNA repair protein RadA/Sms